MAEKFLKNVKEEKNRDSVFEGRNLVTKERVWDVHSTIMKKEGWEEARG
jgi:hypothetical protein